MGSLTIRKLGRICANRAGSLGLSTEIEHEARSTKYVSVFAPSSAIGDSLRSPSSILQDAPSWVSRGGAPLPPTLASAAAGVQQGLPRWSHRNISHSLSYTSLQIVGDVEARRTTAGVENSHGRQSMIRFRKRVGTSGRPQGCRPSAAFAAPHFTGLAPNVTLGSGVGTGRPEFGVGNRVARHPNQRSHPSSGPMDLPGPSACVESGP
jgi:hypothetical protein